MEHAGPMSKLPKYCSPQSRLRTTWSIGSDVNLNLPKMAKKMAYHVLLLAMCFQLKFLGNNDNTIKVHNLKLKVSLCCFDQFLWG